MHGRYVNLFDPDLAILNTVTFGPAARMLLLDLDSGKSNLPRVVAAAARVRDERSASKLLTFRVDGIGETNGIMRIAAPAAPREVLWEGKALEVSRYDFEQGTIRLRFPNTVEPALVEIRFVMLQVSG